MIRWITEEIGTAAWGDSILTPDLAVVDVRNLVDKGGNSVEAVRRKIDEALDRLQTGNRVVICCDYGMSRSNSVAAGVLSLHDNLGLDEAIRRVLDATGETAVKIEVLSTVRQALGVAPTHEKLAGGGKRILITGGGGFIGTALQPLLQGRHEVTAPSRHEADLLGGTVALDLLVKEKGIDTLLHLANPRIFTTNRAMGETLEMLKNVLDVCVENRLTLVYLGSWGIYSGYRAQSLIADETLAPRSNGTYAQTKHLCELLIDQFHQQYGLMFSTLRSSPVYGVGTDKPKFIRNFLRKALNDEEIVTHWYRNGFPALDLLHRDDLCRAIQATLDAEEPVGAVNLGGGEAVSTAEVAEYLVHRVGSQSVIRHQRIDEEIGNVVMDTRRAKSVLGWEPTVHWRDGLNTIVEEELSARSQKSNYHPV